MSQLDQGSEISNDLNENDDSYDEAELQNLKQEIILSNVQLLELTYNDQKFFQKLSELNLLGCQYINKLKYHEALIYLSEAQKILQYAASCGKTIERSLIITTLNNQAALYQRAWELEKAASYIEAIIYNISSFFQGNSSFIFSEKILDQQSSQSQDFSIFIGRKINLSLYFLQFCAVNSQNKNHQNAFSSAFKAVNMLKQICSDLFKYEQYLAKQYQKDKIIGQQSNIQPYKMILYELSNLKQFDQNNLKSNFQKYYQNTLKHMAGYIKRTKEDISQSVNSNYNDIYKEQFANYSIGYLMQINPIKIQRNQNKISIKDQLSDVKKVFKSVYISVGFFILATQLRFISSQKYTLDQNERRNSIEYKQSQIYHLMSIIVASKYLPCESVYFQHIVNSFRNHYKIDILQDAKKFIQQEKENVIHGNKQPNQLYLQNDQNNKNQQGSSIFYKNSTSQYLKQLQQIQKLQVTKKQASIKGGVVHNLIQQVQDRFQNTSSSDQTERQRQRYLLTQQEQHQEKRKTQQNYNLQFSKKLKTKIRNKLTKSQHRLQQSNRIAESTHKQQKNKKISIQYATSRQKQNKIKNKLSSHTSKRSRDLSSHNNLSRKKSQTQGLNHLMTNTKRINDEIVKPHYIVQNTAKNNDYYKTNRSRSKTKKTGEGNKTSKTKRKQSISAFEHRKGKKNELISTKKVQLGQDYGINRKKSYQNLKINGLNSKKSNKTQKKNEINQANIGLQIKKIIKSPKNLKKTNVHSSREKLFF